MNTGFTAEVAGQANDTMFSPESFDDRTDLMTDASLSARDNESFVDAIEGIDEDNVNLWSILTVMSIRGKLESLKQSDKENTLYLIDRINDTLDGVEVSDRYDRNTAILDLAKCVENLQTYEQTNDTKYLTFIHEQVTPSNV